ncbi:unnamed protein product [Coffea canephora]|uniref:Uncharacterized protein n=1 Tax=Coffea canephora TaxID=49390 RepID=A0A068V8J7_COFCA|nr:unnamed protein product [Coffea canephora]
MASSTSSNCADSVLNALENLDDLWDLNVYIAEKLKREFRLLRTFLLCARIWSSFESDCDEHVSLVSFMSKLEAAINESAVNFQPYCRRSGRVMSKKLFRLSLLVRRSIETFRQKINHFYFRFSNILLQTSNCLMGSELIELMDSALENLVDFLLCIHGDDGQVLLELSKDLQQKLRFFQSLIRFSVSRVVEQRQSGAAIAHINLVALNAARIFSVCWLDVKDEQVLNEVQNKISELLQMINPVDPPVREIYMQVLMGSDLSGSSCTMNKEMNKHILGRLVDAFLGNLWEILNCSASLMDSKTDEIHRVYEGLRFLRTILENQYENFDDLPEKLKDIIGASIGEARNVIYSLFKHELKEGSAREMDIVLFAFQENIKLIEAEVSDKYAVTETFKSPSTILEDIKLVNVESVEIDDENFSFEAEKAAQALQHSQSQRTIPTFNQVVVGFDDEAEQIICRLTRGSGQLDIVSIVGMPGLGKTTLANKVYHDPFIICHFQICAWCCISQVYGKKDVLIQILVCIRPVGANEYSGMKEDDLAEELYHRLKGYRYLLVLDDLWDIEAWNGLERLFPDDANGSRILLTSRISKLALEVKPASRPLHLRQLTDDECLELLQKKLIERGGYPPALLLLGKHIAKGCKGLPLTVVIAAGILGNLEQDGWEKVAESLSSSSVCGTEHCMHMLELSYKSLPNYLKPCLLYFGVFLEDQEIPVWRLMRLWIAEGFVQKTEVKSLEDIAEDYIMDLIGRSLVMVDKQKSIGGVKTCRIHDLLHEFCLRKAKEENFLQLRRGYAGLSNFDEPSNIRRLSIYSKAKHFQKSRLFCPLLSSLLVSSQSENYAIPYNFSFILRMFKLLRVLDLGKLNLGFVFPGEISLLVQLRYFAFGGSMTSIPSSIANLWNLETLVLKLSHGSLFLPDTIWNMRTLRYLHGSGSFLDLSLAKDNWESSSDLCNLDTMSALVLDLGQSMDKIMKKFPNIRKLKCSLRETEESSGDWNKVVAIDFLWRLESLKLSFYHVNKNHYEYHFPLNLKKLTLEAFPWSAISSIGRLPNLEVLKLLGAKGYRVEIWNMEEGEFPKLKFLKLEALPVVRWTCSSDHLPCLQKLILHRCMELEELPSCLKEIPTLELIQVHRCPGSVGNLVQQIKEEQMNWGNVDLKILILEEI